MNAINQLYDGVKDIIPINSISATVLILVAFLLFYKLYKIKMRIRGLVNKEKNLSLILLYIEKIEEDNYQNSKLVYFYLMELIKELKTKEFNYILKELKTPPKKISKNKIKEIKEIISKIENKEFLNKN